MTPAALIDERAFNREEQLIGQLSPCGLGLAVDLRAQREALDEDRELPPPLFLRPAWLGHLDNLIREGIAGRLDSTTHPGAKPLGMVVQAPPRHGKSFTTSIFTPAWFLGMFPRRRVILASNEAGLARDFGRGARDLLSDVGPGIFGVQVREDTRAGSDWRTTNGGGMITAGVGGSITGKGADLLIVDDPFKNAEQASSPVIRDKVGEWWISTARTRLHPGAFVLIVLTRWHDDDIAGRLLKAAREDPEVDQWHEVKLPALAKANDPLGRKPGEALWPARYSATDLNKTRKTSGPYWWGAMYQQEPSPDDGGIFKAKYIGRYRITEWKELPARDDEGWGQVASESWAFTRRIPATVRIELDDGKLGPDIGLDHQRIFQTIDLAVSEKQTADFTIIITFASTIDGDLLVLDVERRRIPGPDQPDLVEACMDDWEPESVHVESIGYQTALLQTLVRRALPVLPLDADKDKVTRAAYASARYKSGKVFHPTHAPWLDELEAEMLAFPVGEHDDQVDTLAYGARVQRNLPGQPNKAKANPKARPIMRGTNPRTL